jgi:hypothetical protein
MFAQTAFSCALGQVEGPVQDQAAPTSSCLLRLRDLREPTDKEFDAQQDQLKSSAAEMNGQERNVLWQTDIYTRALGRK